MAGIIFSGKTHVGLPDTGALQGITCARCSIESLSAPKRNRAAGFNERPELDF
jgi:hypothetical protein